MVITAVTMVTEKFEFEFSDVRSKLRSADRTFLGWPYEQTLFLALKVVV